MTLPAVLAILLGLSLAGAWLTRKPRARRWGRWRGRK